jgi:hypothetical protein
MMFHQRPSRGTPVNSSNHQEARDRCASCSLRAVYRPLSGTTGGGGGTVGGCTVGVSTTIGGTCGLLGGGGGDEVTLESGPTARELGANAESWPDGLLLHAAKTIRPPKRIRGLRNIISLSVRVIIHT